MLKKVSIRPAQSRTQTAAMNDTTTMPNKERSQPRIPVQSGRHVAGLNCARTFYRQTGK